MIFSLTLWDFACINNPLILLCGGGGCTGGGNPGVMREGGLREAEEEGAGGGISMGGGEGSGRNGKIFATLAQCFAIGKAHRGGNCYGRGRERGV